MEEKYVGFRLDGQTYAAKITLVREVTYLSTVTRLPNSPAYLEGVFDLRGEVMPVIDLRKSLGLSPRQADSNSRAMIVAIENRPTALVVDGVDQVLTVDDARINPPTDQALNDCCANFVSGLFRSEQGLVILLDLERLLDQQNIAQAGKFGTSPAYG